VRFRFAIPSIRCGQLGNMSPLGHVGRLLLRRIRASSRMQPLLKTSARTNADSH